MLTVVLAEILVVAVAILAVVIVLYNRLIGARQLVRNAWSDMDVYLKRRSDLIPNLVAAVKGFAGHEQALLQALAAARTHAQEAGNNVGARAKPEGEIGHDLFRVLILAESYPDLKSSDNFMNLQKELSETERHIASSRQYYNACVRDLNTKIESFPGNVMAGMMGMKPEPFFEVEQALEREAPSVAGSV